MSTASSSRSHGGPGALDDIDFTHLLTARALRQPNYRAEAEALASLADTLARFPEGIGNALAATALRLTGAHSAGLSLEEHGEGEDVFRWVATAGEFDKYIHATLPRDFSPCGVVLSRDQPVLFREPVRIFPYIEDLGRPVREVLLVPFHVNEKPVGTVWVVSHEEGKTFDSEDLRVVSTITRFAAAAVQTGALVARLRDEAEVNGEKIRALVSWFEHAPGFSAYLRCPELVFEMANRAYCEIAGSTDLVGKQLLEALPILRGQGFDELLTTVYRTGEPYVGREVPVALRLGAERKFVDFVYQPVKAANGEVSGILIQGYECTERKAAMELLQQVDTRKDQFLAVLAHEMRNPLASIRMSGHLLRRIHVDAEMTRKQLDVIDRQSAQLAALLDDLNDLSAIRSGKAQLRVEPLIAQDIVARALEACGSAIQNKGQHLELSLPADPVTLEGDVLRLTQSLINLINNAVKYTPADGRITVAVRQAGEAVHFEVSDTGVGIAPEMLGRVFDMFMQVSMENRPAQGGLGIGLALVRQFVEMHGGMIDVRSDGLDKGSRFAMVIPTERVPVTSPRIRPSLISRGD